MARAAQVKEVDRSGAGKPINTGVLGAISTALSVPVYGVEQLFEDPVGTLAAVGGLVGGIVTVNPVAIGIAGTKLASGTLATFERAQQEPVNFSGTHQAPENTGIVPPASGLAPTGVVDTAPVAAGAKSAPPAAVVTGAAPSAGTDPHPHWHAFTAWLAHLFGRTN